MGGAVIAGGFLNMLLRNSGMIPISDMTGIMEFAGISKRRSQVYASPSYYVFKMYANAAVDRQISVAANSGFYTVALGADRLPEIASVPYLDVTATLSRDGRKLTLFCVNRSLGTDIPATIRLQNFDANRTATVQSLSSAAIADVNDEVNPDKIEPVDRSEAADVTGWSHVFPHASVTVISMDRR